MRVSGKYVVCIGVILGLFLFGIAPRNVWAADAPKYAQKVSPDNGETGNSNKKPKNGWDKSDPKGKVYYYVNGKKQTGKKKIGKATYYFKSNGVRQTGWVKIKERNIIFPRKITRCRPAGCK